MTLYFAPEEPEGKESNWILTVRGKGWYCALRNCGPLESWFVKSWKLDDIILAD